MTGDEAFASKPKHHGEERRLSPLTFPPGMASNIPPPTDFRVVSPSQVPEDGRVTPTAPPILHKEPTRSTSNLNRESSAVQLTEAEQATQVGGPAVPMSPAALAHFSGFVSKVPAPAVVTTRKLRPSGVVPRDGDSEEDKQAQLSKVIGELMNADALSKEERQKN